MRNGTGLRPVATANLIGQRILDIVDKIKESRRCSLKYVLPDEFGHLCRSFCIEWPIFD